MKVAIDVSSLHELNKSRGVGTYTKKLFESLRKYTDLEVELIEKKVDLSKFDLIHYPYFDLFAPTLQVDKNIPTVVTIHDATPLVFPKHYPPGLRGTIKNFHQKKALRKVSAVITDSEASKKDIIKYLKVDSRKIEVVYLAASESFKKINSKVELEEIRKKYQLPEKFVLFTGGTNWNKNLLNLTRAALGVGVHIVFIGKSFENEENLNHVELQPYAEFIQKFGDNPKVHRLGFVSYEDIVPIYNLAKILLLPSFYEGFGLPILEAQQCGTPVITSNASSMPEVAGEGAIYVNPENGREIEKAISDLLADEKLRDKLIKKGLENARKFSWERAARETATVYEKILGK